MTTTHFHFDLFHPSKPGFTCRIVAIVTEHSDNSITCRWTGAGAPFIPTAGSGIFNSSAICLCVGNPPSQGNTICVLRLPATDATAMKMWKAGKEGHCLDGAVTKNGYPSSGWRWRFIGI